VDRSRIIWDHCNNVKRTKEKQVSFTLYLYQSLFILSLKRRRPWLSCLFHLVCVANIEAAIFSKLFCLYSSPHHFYTSLSLLCNAQVFLSTSAGTRGQGRVLLHLLCVNSFQSCASVLISQAFLFLLTCVSSQTYLSNKSVYRQICLVINLSVTDSHLCQYLH